MTWTKVGESRPRDPRLTRLPRGVRWLWLEGTVWCNEHETNGQIPGHELRWITDEPDPIAGAALLVEAGLWEVTPDGWRDVDFLNDQPSAEDVERARVLARDRQRRQRQHRQGDHTLCDPKYCHASRRDSRGSHAVSHDTRTDPSVPEVLGRGEGAGPAPAGAPPADAAEEASRRLGRLPHPYTGDCCPLPDANPIHRSAS
jgi:hypothetical protein